MACPSFEEAAFRDFACGEPAGCGTDGGCGTKGPFNNLANAFLSGDLTVCLASSPVVSIAAGLWAVSVPEGEAVFPFAIGLPRFEGRLSCPESLPFPVAGLLLIAIGGEVTEVDICDNTKILLLN